MKELIRQVLKSELSRKRLQNENVTKSQVSILRRIDSVDWCVEFSVREIERQYNGICNTRTPENFVETVIEKVGDSMYWDYFADTIDDGSEEWGQMYRFIEKYVEHKFGDKLRQFYHVNCGD
jgi:hypothetical protein